MVGGRGHNDGGGRLGGRLVRRTRSQSAGHGRGRARTSAHAAWRRSWGGSVASCSGGRRVARKEGARGCSRGARREVVMSCSQRSGVAVDGGRRRAGSRMTWGKPVRRLARRGRVRRQTTWRGGVVATHKGRGGCQRRTRRCSVATTDAVGVVVAGSRTEEGRRERERSWRGCCTRGHCRWRGSARACSDVVEDGEDAISISERERERERSVERLRG